MTRTITHLGIKIELPTHTAQGAKIAWDREETEPCQAGTPGCCVDHQSADDSCDTW